MVGAHQGPEDSGQYHRSAHLMLVEFAEVTGRRERDRVACPYSAPPTDWIPPFAGMTAISEAIPLQMTPARGIPALSQFDFVAAALRRHVAS